MKLQSLLAIPLIVGIAACSAPPPIEAANRQEAMRICEAENEEALREIAKEKELIKNKPYLFNDDRDDFYDNFYWSFLHSDEFEDVTILKTYCQSRPKQNHNGYWFVVGYIEYLRVPTDGGESEVDKTITSYPTAWKE